MHLGSRLVEELSFSYSFIGYIETPILEQIQDTLNFNVRRPSLACPSSEATQTRRSRVYVQSFPFGHVVTSSCML